MRVIKNVIHIYFIGIGGASMSGLALFTKSMNHIVSGSDLKSSDYTDFLRSKNITIYIGHNSKNIKNVDLVVYNSAISDDNVELIFARNNNIPTIERAIYLGIISRQFKNVIAISGTHGKTTTTSMIGKILTDANLQPTIHVGGVIKEYNSGFKMGKINYFVTEACEYKKNLLHIQADYAIILNVEKDHMDCYKNYDELITTFNQFKSQTKKITFINGQLVDKKLMTKNDKTITFGNSIDYDYYYDNLKENNGTYSADFYHNKLKLFNVKLNLIGEYNIFNALVATCVTYSLGVDVNTIKNSLKTFKNVERRFDFIKKIKKADIYKDYAHHPTQIKSCISASKKISKYENLIVVFQPHTYSRTLTLFDEFLECFGLCDYLFILPTYSAREKIIDGGTAYDLFKSLLNKKENVYYCENFDNCRTKLIPFYESKNLILLIGAGDIENLFK